MHDLYQRLLDFTGDGVYRYTLTDGVVLMANKGLAGILDLGDDPKEIVGRRLHDLLIYTEPEGTIRQRLGEHGELRAYEYHFRTLSGKDKWVLHDALIIADRETDQPIVETIVRDITPRKQAEEAIRRLNAELEVRVALRTAQYEAANKELEAFSYSVAHDLRAPLRAIDGFTGILMEEHHAGLAPEAQRYLKLVCEQARQMSDLVDDLLSLAYISRRQLTRQTVAPAPLIEQVLQTLATQRQGRSVLFRIGSLPNCWADPGLLKIVLMNLLSNALKFTRKRDPAIIEVGCRNDERDGGDVFFVKDNGVGFDMRYVNKLFGVFQRLHGDNEYEGTGIGLATVQRIIHRHDGRVWGESQLDDGATFYFTLGKEACHG